MLRLKYHPKDQVGYISHFHIPMISDIPMNYLIELLMKCRIHFM